MCKQKCAGGMGWRMMLLEVLMHGQANLFVLDIDMCERLVVRGVKGTSVHFRMLHGLVSYEGSITRGEKTHITVRNGR